VALVAASPYALGAAILMILVAYPRRIVVEETILIREFGREYSDYQRKTHRLIPFIY
jgi:protein-S-isoprenylcysteine O-methyltransferase Ste14